jgi:hypothetical protein
MKAHLPLELFMVGNRWGVQKYNLYPEFQQNEIKNIPDGEFFIEITTDLLSF